MGDSSSCCHCVNIKNDEIEKHFKAKSITDSCVKEVRFVFVDPPANKSINKHDNLTSELGSKIKTFHFVTCLHVLYFDQFLTMETTKYLLNWLKLLHYVSFSQLHPFITISVVFWAAKCKID